jgi:hypothetical protein
MNYLEKYKKYKKKYFHAKEIERYIDIEGGEKNPFAEAREKKKRDKQAAKFVVKASKKYETKLPDEIGKSLDIGKNITTQKSDFNGIKKIYKDEKMIMGHCNNCGEKYDRKSFFCKFCKRISHTVSDELGDLAKVGMKLDAAGEIRKELISTIKLTDPSPGKEENLRWHTFKNLAYLAGTDIKIDDKKRNRPTFLTTINSGWSIGVPHKLKKKVYGKHILGHIFNVPGGVVKDPRDVEGKKKLSRNEIKALVAHKICCVYFIEMLININSVMKMGKGAKMAKQVSIKKENYKHYYNMVYIIITAIKEIDITHKELKKWWDYIAKRYVDKMKQDGVNATKPLNKGAIEYEYGLWDERWKRLHTDTGNGKKIDLFKQFVELKIIAFNFYYQYAMDGKIKDKGRYVLKIEAELEKIRNRKAYEIDELMKNKELAYLLGGIGDQEVKFEKIEHFSTAKINSRYDLLSPARWARKCETLSEAE